MGTDAVNILRPHGLFSTLSEKQPWLWPLTEAALSCCSLPVATLKVQASPRRQGDGRLPGLHQGWTSRKRAYSEIDSVSALLMLMLPRVMAALDVEAMRPLPLLIGPKVPIAP